ncbi:MAG: hypothetical protein V4632_10655 [Pseudomonadota bacterium]
MSTTYYLLRTKDGMLGNGPYLGHDDQGESAMVATIQDAHRFDELEVAEQRAAQLVEQFGEFEVEVRNSDV